MATGYAKGNADMHAVAFAVQVDDNDLGYFDSCQGLGCKLVTESRAEGGNRGMVYQLPTQLTFTPVTLSRYVTPDSGKIIKLFANLDKGIRRSTAKIEARTLAGTLVLRWILYDVLPAGWSGPQLSIDSTRAATETLELAHHGFRVETT